MAPALHSSLLKTLMSFLDVVINACRGYAHAERRSSHAVAVECFVFVGSGHDQVAEHCVVYMADFANFERVRTLAVADIEYWCVQDGAEPDSFEVVFREAPSPKKARVAPDGGPDVVDDFAIPPSPVVGELPVAEEPAEAPEADGYGMPIMPCFHCGAVAWCACYDDAAPYYGMDMQDYSPIILPAASDMTPDLSSEASVCNSIRVRLPLGVTAGYILM